MKRVLVLAFAALALFANQAQGQSGKQDEYDPADYEVVLPSKAQKCVLPASPDAIPDQASYEDLVAAKSQITTFQSEIQVFRDCLTEADEDQDNTPGNKQAILESYNYSVEMEERIAERFNSAVRDYKERKAAAEG